MSGTDKRKLLVIGKSSKPRCSKGIRMESLPVQYYVNKNAWMTSGIFKNWLMSWDMELQYKERTILLLVDSGTSSFRFSKKYKTTFSVS